jgi:hypothetical protein
VVVVSRSADKIHAAVGRQGDGAALSPRRARALNCSAIMSNVEGNRGRGLAARTDRAGERPTRSCCRRRSPLSSRRARQSRLEDQACHETRAEPMETPRFGAIAAVPWSRSTWWPIQAHCQRSYVRLEIPKNESLHAQGRARDAEATNSPHQRDVCQSRVLVAGYGVVATVSIQRIERSCPVDVEAAIVRHLRCEAISAIVTGLPAE